MYFTNVAPVALTGQHSFVPLLCKDQSFLGPADSRLEVLQHALTEPEKVVEVERPFGSRRLIVKLGLQLVVVNFFTRSLKSNQL